MIVPFNLCKFDWS